MQLYLNIQRALICCSCKEAALRSLSDLIPVSCSVYPADTSVQKMHQIQPCTFGCTYVYACTRICIGHTKEKILYMSFIFATRPLRQDRNHTPFPSSTVPNSDFSRTTAELNTACGEREQKTPSLSM